MLILCNNGMLHLKRKLRACQRTNRPHFTLSQARGEFPHLDSPGPRPTSHGHLARAFGAHRWGRCWTLENPQRYGRPGPGHSIFSTQAPRTGSLMVRDRSSARRPDEFRARLPRAELAGSPSRDTSGQVPQRRAATGRTATPGQP
jgi:hypothetical protein